MGFHGKETEMRPLRGEIAICENGIGLGKILVDKRLDEGEMSLVSISNIQRSVRTKNCSEVSERWVK